MHEVTNSGQNPAQLLKAAETIGWEALSDVTAKYGTGFDDTTPEVRALHYHNMIHTMDVRDDALLTARMLGMQPIEQAVVHMAASAHDIIQLDKRGNMERDSADWLADKMERAGFSEYYTQAGRLAILGTTPLYDSAGQYVDQLANQLEYPDETSAAIAASVAAGDMALLYAPEGPQRSRQLYLEYADLPAGQEPDLQDWLRFQKNGLKLLNTYHFPVSVAEQLFGGLRHQVIDHEIAVTQDVWLGRIATWAELEQADKEFAACVADSFRP